MHKGFKCLDISTGRIYISHDVVFDEAVFRFSKLHPNAGASLRKEIILLPSSLRNPGDDHCTVSDITDNTNVPGVCSGSQEQSAGNSKESAASMPILSPASAHSGAEDHDNGSHVDLLSPLGAAERS